MRTTNCFLLLISGFFCHINGQSQAAFSVQITEVMFDPVPVVQLPNSEYVELQNCSMDTIQLRNWIWQVGERMSRLPETLLAPDECVVLVPAHSAELFSCRAVCPDKWLTLPNSGQYLVLKNAMGQIIHFVRYSPAWFEDALQREGGHSLELVCRDHPAEESSWQPASHPSGGTPGFRTLQDCQEPNMLPFHPLRAGWLNHTEGLLLLSSYLRPDTPGGDLVLKGTDGAEFSWSFYQDQPNYLHFVLPDDPGDPCDISIRIAGPALSCSGQPLEEQVFRWGSPQHPDSASLLISEILFDPLSGAYEFIEMYNHSEKIIDLNEVIIATTNEMGQIKSFSTAGAASCLIFPREYIAVTTDRAGLCKWYPDAPPGNIHERRDLPTLANAGGGIRILSSDQRWIDEVRYDPSWHFIRIADEKGVSLERISFNQSGLLAGNWFSAAGSTGHSTPGEKNSQHLDETQIPDQNIFLNQTLITPNLDGDKDVAVLEFSFSENGYTGELLICSPSGAVIRHAFNWGVLPVNGCLLWDGRDDNGQMVSEGIYILLFNYRTSEGKRGRWKKAIGVLSY